VAPGKHAEIRFKRNGQALNLGEPMVGRIIKSEIQTKSCITKRKGRCG